jgi:TorA maturation chaperone TorD
LNAVERAVHAGLWRAGVYRVLAAAFAYPTLERVRDVARASATLAVTTPAGILRDALAAFSAAAYTTDAEHAATEYVFLFDREARCPAHEGAWGDPAAMAGRVARLADVAGFYGAFGFEAGGAQPDSEDHVVPELEFMSAIAVKAAWAIAEGHDERAEIADDAATKFLSEHLGRWARAFAHALAGATAVPYYTTAAGLLCEWIATDVVKLGATPDAIDETTGVDPVQGESFACPMAPEPAGD